MTIKILSAALLSAVALGACQPQDAKNENHNSTSASSSHTLQENQETIERNKKVVLDFYQQMFGDKDLSAVDQYILPNYIQHNPTVADGAAAFKTAAETWFKGAPKSKVDIQRVAAEGELVFIHVKNQTPSGQYVSTVDIFRLENGKIAEHWDVHQEVPAEAANEHPMF